MAAQPTCNRQVSGFDSPLGLDRTVRGEVPERLIGADCKSAARKGYTGSNPVLSTILPALDKYLPNRYNGNNARIAQLAERVLGKNEVISSNLIVGLKDGGING